MTLQHEILDWDGKSSEDINAIYIKYFDQKQFVNTLIKCLADVNLQKGGSWLLKKHLEEGNKLDRRKTDSVFQQLDALSHWESKLHLLQSLAYLDIPEKHKENLECFLRRSLNDKNKFLRTWAYNGFYQLAICYPEYTVETKQFFEMALRDEAPSIKARIRNILKRGF